MGCCSVKPKTTENSQHRAIKVIKQEYGEKLAEVHAQSAASSSQQQSKPVAPIRRRRTLKNYKPV